MSVGLSIYCGFGRLALDGDAIAVIDGGTQGHRVEYSCQRGWSNLEAACEPAMEGADVIFGQPGPSIAEKGAVRWVQLTSAGYERYHDERVRRAFQRAGIVVTTASSVYADPCAEHLLAMMLAFARQLLVSFEEQRGQRAWPSAERRRGSQLLRGQKVMVLGYGAIARRLLQLLAPFEVDALVVRRRPRGDEPVAVIGESELDQALTGVHHLVSTLPGSAAGFLDEARLSRLSHDAFFYNVGRGNTVDQQALLSQLNAGALAGAYLDVTEPEPLPQDHPLWSAPGCYITPHSAGGRTTEHRALAQHFVANLQRFVAGVPLVDRVL